MLRTLESRRALVAGRSPRRWSRVGWVAGIVVFGVLAGVLVARSSGSRGAGEATGDVLESTRTLIFEAERAAAAGEWDEAIDLDSRVLEIEPSNEQAWAYRGWFRFRRDAADAEAALSDLDEAVALDPGYPDARVFRASVRLRTGDTDGARDDLAAFDAADPPPAMDELVSAMGLRSDIVAAVLTAPETPTLTEAGLDVDEATDAGIDLILRNELLAAAQVLESVLADSGDHVPALAYRGYVTAVAAGEGDPDLVAQAGELLDRAVALDPDSPDARAIRATYRASLLDDATGAADDVEAYEATGDRTPHLRQLLASAGLSDG